MSNTTELENAQRETPDVLFELHHDDGLVYPIKGMKMSVIDPLTNEILGSLTLCGPQAHSVEGSLEAHASANGSARPVMPTRFPQGAHIVLTASSGIPSCMKPPLPPACFRSTGTTTPITGTIQMRFEIEGDR